MIRFLARRAAWSIVVLWFIVSATFVLTVAIPSEPARTLVGPHAGADAVARVRRDLCLDRSFLEQYGCYVARIARGDLGQSFRARRPVAEILVERAVPTAQLALAAIALQLAGGVLLGAVAARRRGSPVEAAIDAFAVLAISAPAFVVGPLLMDWLAYRMGWLPIAGHGELRHIVLPALTLAVGGAGVYARLVRDELAVVLDEDFSRAARARGASEAQVVRAGLRNVMVPLVSVIGVDLGVLAGGAVVVESLFGWPGLGRETWMAIQTVDLPVILGVVLVVACAVLVVSLLADVAVALLDPRVRLPS